MTATPGNANVLSALRRTQHELERLYELEPGPDVALFVHFDDEQPHETVLVRQTASDDIEMMVLLPADLELQASAMNDSHLQLIEGVSHFVLLTERARTELPATRLELEIQAEVDKFALLVGDPSVDTEQARQLHGWLFERVGYLHPAESEDGQRYRHANDIAARLCARLDLGSNLPTSRALLRRF